MFGSDFEKFDPAEITRRPVEDLTLQMKVSKCAHSGLYFMGDRPMVTIERLIQLQARYLEEKDI